MISLETDLNRIAALAEQYRDDNRAFAHFIDIMWEREGRSDAELDALVEQIAADVSRSIDCTACANCCRTLTVGLEPDDVDRLAAGLGCSAGEVLTRYVDRAAGAAFGEWATLRGVPCPLLRDNLCRVYAHRPLACAQYPAFTPDFRWLLDYILEDVGRCPIVFNVIERLKARLGW
jgi:Fe-S-cluster containining protein